MFLAAQARAASSQRWLFVCGVLHRLAGESRRKRFKSPSFWERSTKADEDVLQTLLLLETFFKLCFCLRGAGAQRDAWQGRSARIGRRSAIPPSGSSRTLTRGTPCGDRGITRMLAAEHRG